MFNKSAISVINNKSTLRGALHHSQSMTELPNNVWLPVVNLHCIDGVLTSPFTL